MLVKLVNVHLYFIYLVYVSILQNKEAVISAKMLASNHHSYNNYVNINMQKEMMTAKFKSEALSRTFNRFLQEYPQSVYFHEKYIQLAF